MRRRLLALTLVCASGCVVLLASLWATEQPAFHIRDWHSLRIRLVRTECFGACPDYTVSINGDGEVEFEGRRFVAVNGVQRAHISREQVKELVSVFERAGYFSLADSYEEPVTDMPRYTTSIAFDDKEKTVVDYAGRMAHMPKQVTEVENAIDRIANTARWIKGPDKTR